MCENVVILYLLHVPATCRLSVYYTSFLSLQHVAATCPCNMTPPLVSAHFKGAASRGFSLAVLGQLCAKIVTKCQYPGADRPAIFDKVDPNATLIVALEKMVYNSPVSWSCQDDFLEYSINFHFSFFTGAVNFTANFISMSTSRCLR